VDEAWEMVKASGSKVAVVDVRTPDEYKAGHVADAIWIPVDEVLSRSNEMPNEKRLLFICAAGQRSALACEMAAALGFDPELLYNIEQGTGTWIERGYPTSYDQNP
jgi:rhodanese-related sulfurtransferase